MTNWKEMPAWQHLQKYRPLLYELVVRDLKVKYRRSFLGYLWSLLNPLLMMAVMSFVFSYIFRYDIENYPLYLICGQTLWGFFNESTNMAMYSVLQNGSLIKKVYIPKFIFPMSRVFSSFVTMSFSLGAILIVMLVTRAPLHWQLLLFPLPLILLRHGREHGAVLPVGVLPGCDPPVQRGHAGLDVRHPGVLPGVRSAG